MDNFSKNKEEIIQYLRNGCKPSDMAMHFGVELEHFVVHAATKEAVAYEGEHGIESLLKELMPFYKESAYSQEHLIALSREGIALSLEPGAQLEVSISPQTDVFGIKEIYDSFCEEIYPILEKHSYEMVTVGYQPKSKVNELGLLPKARYEYMDQYFCSIGPWGRRMMRGTASTQVSIDYYSEEDFMKKYRIAYYLKDVLSWFFSNTHMFEGEVYSDRNLRDIIWSGTDKRRVEVSPYMVDNTLSFENYANFVMQTPVIVNKEAGREYYDERTIGEIAEERIFSMDEMVHMLSMVFPMIRAKQFLELRFADSMPMDRVLCYVLLIKGLFSDVEYTQKLIFTKEFEKMNADAKMRHIVEGITSKLSKAENEYLEDCRIWEWNLQK